MSNRKNVRFTIIGGTGDLAQRKLFPTLEADGYFLFIILDSDWSFISCDVNDLVLFVDIQVNCD